MCGKACFEGALIYWPVLQITTRSTSMSQRVTADKKNWIKVHTNRSRDCWNKNHENCDQLLTNLLHLISEKRNCTWCLSRRASALPTSFASSSEDTSALILFIHAMRSLERWGEKMVIKTRDDSVKRTLLDSHKQLSEACKPTRRVWLKNETMSIFHNAFSSQASMSQLL